MAALVKEMGFDGIDLTVRANGHVLPERVADDLPKAVAAAEKAGIKVYMLTTGINSASDAHTEAILKTASSLGIRYYRTDWFYYNPNRSIQDNLAAFKKRFESLEILNRKYNIHGAYQNHAGKYFGAAVWDLWETIKDLDPEYTGCQYDIRHATVEGPDTWPLALELLQKNIRSVAIKDYSPEKKNGVWAYSSVPLATGMVNFKQYLQQLKKMNFSGPQSMHFEYPLGGAEDGARKISITTEAFRNAVRSDLVKYKSMLAQAGF